MLHCVPLHFRPSHTDGLPPCSPSSSLLAVVQFHVDAVWRTSSLLSTGHRLRHQVWPPAHIPAAFLWWVNGHDELRIVQWSALLLYLGFCGKMDPLPPPPPPLSLSPANVVHTYVFSKYLSRLSCKGWEINGVFFFHRSATCYCRDNGWTTLEAIWHTKLVSACGWVCVCHHLVHRRGRLTRM